MDSAVKVIKLKMTVFAIAAISLLGSPAFSGSLLICGPIFDDSKIELELRSATQELSTLTKEYQDLPELPGTYFLTEYVNFPRVRLLAKKPASVGPSYYTNIYRLEQKIKKGEASPDLYLDLAKMYLDGWYVTEAVWTLMRAGREDLARYVVEEVKHELPKVPSSSLNDLSPFIAKFKADKYYRDAIASTSIKKMQEYHWSELELQASRLMESESTSDRVSAKKLYHELGADYLSHNMYQEAIWAYRAAGDFKKADELQDYVLKVLLTGDLHNTGITLKGVTKSQVYELAPGIRVIAKKQSGILTGRQNPNDEVIAYKLSELLRLNMISTTVLRKINGQTHSLQLMIRPMYESARWLDYSKEKNRSDITMDVFDYLIVNQDRRNEMGPHNTVIRMGAIRALIDHGVIFRPYFVMRYIPILKNSNQNIDIINDPTNGIQANPIDPQFIKIL
ncbi:MAG: hypothetical protein KDD37_09495, partial [Bdellovibrionales bacterium]|nr:hypothetical protein [Bdellovibrionales bacterium]